jgi:uncharacterized membrane protein
MAYMKMSIRQPAAVAFEFLASFPIACFSLTVLTDIAYWQTENLLWLHFSEWLLLAGLGFGCLAGILALVGRLVAKEGPTWLTLLGLLVVGCLAALNSFIHTADGWTAVVPYGLAVSVATVLTMVCVLWFGQEGEPHV